ncbi:MAG: AAA family ATPase [Rhodovibrio sp.]|nr:AAA family ATPase [Rhodovibrio sp.]
MIIRGWQIDGFGHFRDQRSPELTPGLSVLHGPNEAGKSTLLAFVRGVLFGFPDKRSKGKQPLYEPPGGGAYGGSVFVEHDGRRYQIHRRAGSRNNRATITDAEGHSVPEGDLPQILGGADETLFKNVFGFSLWELQEGESLTDEGVRDRIFSNAVAGAGRDARKAAEELETRAKELYSPNPRQKKNQAAKLLDEIKQVDQELGEARAAARDYPNKLEAERAAAAEKARLDRDIAHWRARGRELDALLRLWEPWCARARALETLERLTGRSFTPTDPVPADSALDAQQRQADALRESLGLQRQRLQEADEQANQLQAEDEKLQRTLETLGSAWTEARVEAFALPIPAREEVRGWERALNDAETTLTKADEQRAEAERRRRESAERHAKYWRADLDNVADPPPDLATLQARQGELEDLRGKTGELARQRDAEGYARTAAAERRGSAVQDRARQTSRPRRRAGSRSPCRGARRRRGRRWARRGWANSPRRACLRSWARRWAPFGLGFADRGGARSADRLQQARGRP